MLFNSHVFIFCFLPATLAGFFLLGRAGAQKAAIWWLGAASLFFYGWWNPSFLWLILLSILFNYGVGWSLARSPGNRALLTLGVAGDLALLGFYKYFDFLVVNLARLDGGWSPQGLVLPLGISFFTFTQIAFLVDVYRGEAKEYDLGRYVLFVTFFPHLIAGPILHHREMMPQFADRRVLTPSLPSIEMGLTLFVMGLAKKVLVADGIEHYAAPVFQAADIGELPTFTEAWTGALSYTFEIYYDFSGYSDMALGLGLLFGIRLPLNFYSPYKATSIIDFWRRWHITLSRFLRDYLYIPLGGNRRGESRRFLNLFVTMLLGGLWHGAGWTFVAWGALHGLYLVINHLSRRVFGPLVRASGPVRWACWLATFLAVVVAWVFFRAETMDDAWILLRGMAGMNGLVLPAHYAVLLGPLAGPLQSLGWQFHGTTGPYFGALQVIALAVLLAASLLLPNSFQLLRRYDPVCNPQQVPDREAPHWIRWQPSLAWAIAGGLAFAVTLLALTRESEFLYFQF